MNKRIVLFSVIFCMFVQLEPFDRIAPSVVKSLSSQWELIYKEVSSRWRLHFSIIYLPIFSFRWKFMRCELCVSSESDSSNACPQNVCRCRKIHRKSSSHRNRTSEDKLQNRSSAQTPKVRFTEDGYPVRNVFFSFFRRRWSRVSQCVFSLHPSSFFAIK